jgi:glycosyltransferase involved in cell wall biosynthesis
VIHALAEGLHERGHSVTLLASADSSVSCQLVPTVSRACWTGGSTDVDASFARVLEVAWREHDGFDLVHSHLESQGFEFARSCPTPVLSTMHGRLDDPGTSAALHAFADVPVAAISHSQRDQAPWANWLGVVHNGLDLARIPFGPTGGEYLLFVGRVAEEKGIVEAIDVATQAGRQLLIAAKILDAAEAQLFETAVRPRLRPGRIEFLGEVPAADRDQLFAGACATLMLGDWPEPFGLVAIESMAAGTPVIARRRGALPEIVEEGIDGFLVNDPVEAVTAVEVARYLDRNLVRQRAFARFSASRMVDDYLALYGRILGRDTAEAARAAERPLDLVS